MNPNLGGDGHLSWDSQRFLITWRNKTKDAGGFTRIVVEVPNGKKPPGDDWFCFGTPMALDPDIIFKALSQLLKGPKTSKDILRPCQDRTYYMNLLQPMELPGASFEFQGHQAFVWEALPPRMSDVSICTESSFVRPVADMLEAIKPNEGKPSGLWFNFLGRCFANGNSAEDQRLLLVQRGFPICNFLSCFSFIPLVSRYYDHHLNIILSSSFMFLKTSRVCKCACVSIPHCIFGYLSSFSSWKLISLVDLFFFFDFPSYLTV